MPERHVLAVHELTLSVLKTGEAVEMDVSHASVQGCTRSLTSNVFDTGCHSFSSGVSFYSNRCPAA